MSINLSGLSVAEAKELKDGFILEKRGLDARKETKDVRTETAADDSKDTAKEIAETQAEIDASEIIIGNLPDGDKKEDEVTKKMDLEVKLRKLKKAARGKSALDLAQAEIQVFFLEKRVLAINEVITQIDAYIASIS